MYIKLGRKIKKVSWIVVIVLVLSYAITVFMSRETVQTNQNIMLDEYCIWMLSKEVSSDYEDEMIKAQAVIVRTSVYHDIKEIEADDIELLQDMIMVSVNDAINQINKETEAKMGKYTQGMPGLF